MLLPFITEERFSHGERAFGFVLAAFGLGGAVGAVIPALVKLPRRYLTFMMSCWGVGSLPIAAIGYTRSFSVMAVCAFAAGLSSGAASVIWGTLLYRRVPPRLLGRVHSVDLFVSLMFMPASMAMAGPVARMLSSQSVFLAAGTIPIGLSVLAWASARMARDEAENPLP